ncbi:MAG: hypothetical protein ACJAV1_000603 [Paraglaciecola sp.]
MRIYLACIILSLLALISHSSMARKTLFTQAHCTIVYSLKRSADKEFNDEITQLMTQVNKKNIQFADLNHWGKTPPHIEISGRSRNQFRQYYAMQKGIDQMVVVNKKGKILRRYSGSVTLVNALLDCG